MERTIKVNGNPIFFGTEITMTKSFVRIRENENYQNGKGRRLDICPFCKKELQVGDETVLVINNNKLFPNVISHIDCINVLNDNKLAKKCQDLVSEYEEFKKTRAIWG